MNGLGINSFQEIEDTFTNSRISGFSDFSIIEIDPLSILFNIADVMTKTIFSNMHNNTLDFVLVNTCVFNFHFLFFRGSNILGLFRCKDQFIDGRVINPLTARFYEEKISSHFAHSKIDILNLE